MTDALSGEQFAHQTGHRPASPDYGAPLHDVEQAMPDYYERPNLYDHPSYGGGPETNRQIQAARGNPDHPVKIYRSTMEGGGINPGDWVTTSKRYARFHGDRNLEEGQKHVIEEMTVPAKHLWTEGNAVHEWGYHPGG